MIISQNFHRDNDSYKNIKAIPRPRKKKKKKQARLWPQEKQPNQAMDRVESLTAGK